jgi:hypothetical protein
MIQGVWVVGSIGKYVTQWGYVFIKWVLRNSVLEMQKYSNSIRILYMVKVFIKKLFAKYSTAKYSSEYFVLSIQLQSIH